MKYLHIISLIFFVSCSNKTETCSLVGTLSSDENLIFSTSKADYYFDKQELLQYYRLQRSTTAYENLWDFIEEDTNRVIVLADTVARMKSEDGSTMRNDNHRYAHIQEDIGWTIIEFAQKGNLKIYSHISDDFLTEVTFFERDDNIAGTSGLSQSDSILVEELRWIK